jgi:hypothetical protein
MPRREWQEGRRAVHRSVQARWKRGGIILSLALGLAGCGTIPATSTSATPAPPSTGAAGDPGGRMLAALRPVASAVPSQARMNWTHFDEPKLDSCDGQPETEGYEPVTVQADFSWQESADTVLASVRHALESTGWRWTGTAPPAFPGQNYGTTDAIGTWAKTLPGGRPATAALSTAAAGTEWSLIAEAPATLPPPKQCGAPS